MILSSCHDYSLNNDCHCHCHCHWHCHFHYMQRIYVYFICSCLALSCHEWTSITIVIIGMTLYELVLHYIIISYHVSCSFILSLLLIWSPFYSILFYSILFYRIRFTILFSIVSHTNEWFVSICPSVCPSICLSVCLFICMNKFMFSLLSCFFILSLLFRFFFHFHFFFFTLFLFLWTSSSHSHTHTDTDTDTQIHMNICSFLWLVHITSKARKWRIVFEW